MITCRYGKSRCGVQCFIRTTSLFSIIIDASHIAAYALDSHLVEVGGSEEAAFHRLEVRIHLSVTALHVVM